MGVLERNFPTISPGLWARRKAMTQGLLGESRVWQIIGLAIFVRIVMRKILRTGPELVTIERLEAGQRIILTGLRNGK